MDSLLVLTGVSGPAELLAAPESRRPTYVAADLAGLFRPGSASRIPVTADELGGWQLTREDKTVTLTGDGDAVDGLRLLTGPAWDGAEIKAGSEQARTLLTSWGLTV
jgi:glycerol 3-phosphatase-2